jgi:DNA-binding MarR family transcriptional regulator
VPDVTRLLDRMEQAGLITRARTGEDRRYVTTRITAKGLSLLDRLDSEVNALHERLTRHMTAAQLKTLVQLLRDVREPL